MKENTFTFTARSAENPERMATFTLHNGSVSVALGNALLEQAEEAIESLGDETEDRRLTAWIEPAATGALQKLLQPVPLDDFDADLQGNALQTTAWIRARGLRLAPVMMTWNEVDNPEGARAFVEALDERKEAVTETGRLPDPLDYWATWLLIGVLTIALPILLLRQLKERKDSGSEA